MGAPLLHPERALAAEAAELYAAHVPHGSLVVGTHIRSVFSIHSACDGELYRRWTVHGREKWHRLARTWLGTRSGICRPQWACLSVEQAAAFREDALRTIAAS